MEGRPWLRILLVLLGFSLLGWPVWVVTHQAGATFRAAPKAGASAEALRITVTFSMAPAILEIEYLGAALASVRDPGADVSVDWNAAIPREGADLFVSASWPPGSPQALRVRVTRAGDPVADQTFWADGRLAGIVTVRGQELQ